MSVHNIKYVSHQSAAVLSLLFEKVVEGPSRHSIALFYTHMWIGLACCMLHIYMCVYMCIVMRLTGLKSVVELQSGSLC